jgi:hypothetical protein
MPGFPPDYYLLMQKRIEPTIVVGGLALLALWLFVILPLGFYAY